MIIYNNLMIKIIFEVDNQILNLNTKYLSNNSIIKSFPSVKKVLVFISKDFWIELNLLNFALACFLRVIISWIKLVCIAFKTLPTSEWLSTLILIWFFFQYTFNSTFFFFLLNDFHPKCWLKFLRLEITYTSAENLFFLKRNSIFLLNSVMISKFIFYR